MKDERMKGGGQDPSRSSPAPSPSPRPPREPLAKSRGGSLCRALAPRKKA
jgi:hypothetical protein